LLAVLLTSLAWLILAGGAALTWRQPQPLTFQVQPPPATATPAATPTPPPIKVEVAGAVLHPGVYELPASARVADALAAAGGLTNNANGDALNQAGHLQDGEKLVAPAAQLSQPPLVAATASTPDLTSARRGGIDLDSTGLVNINSASAPQLEALPSIGPVTAKAIIDYRAANGPFRSVEEIVKVKGIGPATLEKIKLLITVGE
jgi:competence protein ComEA